MEYKKNIQSTPIVIAGLNGPSYRESTKAPVYTENYLILVKYILINLCFYVHNACTVYMYVSSWLIEE